MDKRKNGEGNRSGNRVIVTIFVLALLMVTGVLPVMVDFVVSLALGIVGLMIGLGMGFVGLVLGLFGAAIGLIFGLLPIVLTIGVIVMIVRAINGDSEKRKNDDIHYV
jgi:hypothetical protein